MPVNKSVMNRHRDRHHQSAFPYDGFSGIQQRVVIAASPVSYTHLTLPTN